MEIGIDTGGTFTDLVCRIPGQADRILKVPSTPDDPSRAVLDGVTQVLALASAAPASVLRVVHGTTVATNAVLERKGARIGLVTSAGFRDVLEIGRQIRTAIYDLQLEPETPVFLAPRARRVEVAERLSASGAVLTALDEAALATAVDGLAADGCVAIAICFLFSFLNPTHEQRAREIILERHPQMAVSLSCEVDPAFREYERTVVTAFDAYTKPILSDYLQRIGAQLVLNGVRAPLQVMQSRGGVSAAATAVERPVRLFLSGPAAGVVGGGRVAREAGTDNVITLDIGGTSCDIALITDGQPRVRAEGLIGGFPVRVPMVDVTAIGSGGGSIAWLDAAGGLRVGPQSAGAAPGPACYARGGELPTVTDASLVLGILNGDNFAGASMGLDIEHARAAIEGVIAAPLAMSAEQSALGIHRVLNAQMAEAMRLVTIQQGFDPREFALVALGGAGPVHACALAGELGITTIVVPLHPGVLSADGLLAAPIEHEVSVGFPRDLSRTSMTEVRAVIARLDTRCAGLMAGESVEDAHIKVAYSADVCYVGQSHFLQVGFEPASDDALESIYARFIALHEQVYGYATEVPARIVNLRTVHRASASSPPDPPPPVASGPRVDDDESKAGAVHRNVIFDDAKRPLPTPIYKRSNFSVGQLFEGPAIVEQADTTTVVHPGWSVEVLQHGNLKLVRLQ